MKKYPLYIKTFISFMSVIFATTIILGTIFNYYIVNYSEDEISKASIVTLKNADSMSMIFVNGIEKEAVKFSLNQTINDSLNAIANSYRDINDINSPEGLTQFNYVSRYLNEIINENEGITSVYVYLKDADYIISSNQGITYTKNFFDISWIDKYENSKEQGINALWLNTRKIKRISDTKDEDISNMQNVITYIYPLGGYSNRINGAIVINLNEDKLSGLINSDKNGSIIITTPKGDIISHVNSNTVSKNISNEDYINKIIKGKLKEGYIITNINNTKQLITYYKNDINEWIYVGMFPLSSLMSKVNILQRNIIYIMFGIFIIVIFITYIISKKIYNPVNVLVNNIKNKKSLDISSNDSEVSIISTAFNSIMKEQDVLNDIIEKNKVSLKSKYLLDIINGIIPNKEEMLSAGINFKYDNFICCILSIDNYDRFNSDFQGAQLYYMKELIINVSEKVIAEYFICYGADLRDENIIFIINNEDEEIKSVEILQKCFEEIQIQISKIMDNKISVGIGSIFNSIQKIKKSYSHSLEAINMKLLLGNGKIIKYKEYDELDNKYYYPSSEEKLILSCLKNHSEEAVIKAIQEFTISIKSINNIRYDNIIFIINHLLGKILEYLLDESIRVNTIFSNNYNIYAELSKKETIDDVEKWLIEINLKIIRYCTEKDKKDKTHIIKASEYIHQNYMKDIDVNTLADYTGISYSQLRRIFIEGTGDNVVNYINNLRIEKAKAMLKDTSRNISDIAVSVGYNNDQSFNRYFKKYEGITPGEYRNKNKK